MATSPRRRTAAAKPRILVVDDHPIVRRGIAQLIEDEDDLVLHGEADSAATAMAMVDDSPPDLVVLDLTLAQTNGLSLIRDLRARDASLHILVLSMHDETLFAERVLRAGASGYIMKQEATDHIVEAIRQVLGGRIFVSERMTSRILQRWAASEPEAAATSPLEGLSNRELEVLQLVGQGRSTREIAAQLFLSVKTVETHLEHLKTKLHLQSARELVRYAIRHSLGEL